MFRRRILAAAVGSLVLAGCGGGGGSGGVSAGGSVPRIDATDNATLGASMTRIRDSLDEARKQQFTADVLLLTAPKAGKGKKGAAVPNLLKIEGAELLKPLNGLSADEVHAKAEEVRAGLKSAKK